MQFEDVLEPEKVAVVMNEALKAIKFDGKGLRQAARDFDVPVTTLKRKS